MARKKEFIMSKDNLAYEEPINDCFTHGTALTQASTLMNTIISKNIFLTKNGAFTGKSGATLTQRQVTKLDVA